MEKRTWDFQRCCLLTKMKKIFLSILLCLFTSSVNAGLKEIGQGEVGTDVQNQIKNQYEKKIKKKKNEDKKFILYFYRLLGA